VCRYRTHFANCRFRRHAQSAGTVADLCRGEGVSIPTFYQRRKKLVRSTACRQPGQGRAFRPVMVTPDPQAGAPAALSVRLPGGVQLEVPRENLEAVRVVVAELARAQRGPGALRLGLRDSHVAYGEPFNFE